MNGNRSGSVPWVGVLGGSFDPVHLGHLRLAETVRSSFSLSTVLLVPTAIPPHKPDARLAPAADRLAMLELAIEGHDGLEISTVELDRGGVSFTIDTLRGIRDDADRPRRPLFILGMDSLIDIPTWKEHSRLLDEFVFVVVDRPGGQEAADRARLPAPIARRMVAVAPGPGEGASELDRHGRAGAIFLLTLRPVEISSSRIRRLARTSGNLGSLVPSAVARYIQREKLYRQEAGR